MANWAEFGVLTTLMDFQNNLFCMVVQAVNSIMEIKNSVYVLRLILSLNKLDASVNQAQ